MSKTATSLRRFSIFNLLPGSSLLSSSLAPWIDKREKFLKKRIATSPQCILHSAPLQTVARLAQW